MSTKGFQCLKCKSLFATKQRLQSHEAKKKNCVETNIEVNVSINSNNASSQESEELRNEIEMLKEKLKDLEKENCELKAKLECKDETIAILREQGMRPPIIESIPQQISSKKSFCIDDFLKNKCSEGVDILEFAKKVYIDWKDCDNFLCKKWSEVITTVFKRELNKLDVSKRPLHCRDIDRQLFCVKSNGQWLKEDDNTVIKQAVKIIYNKIFSFGMAEWKQKNTDWVDVQSRTNDKYMKIILVCTTGFTEIDNNCKKVIKNLTSFTKIDKSV
jgi:hypothetical protein